MADEKNEIVGEESVLVGASANSVRFELSLEKCSDSYEDMTSEWYNFEMSFYDWTNGATSVSLRISGAEKEGIEQLGTALIRLAAKMKSEK